MEQAESYTYRALFGLQGPGARGVRRCRCVRARARADQQPRSMPSASATATPFSHIKKLIDEQNRGKLTQVAKVCVVSSADSKHLLTPSSAHPDK